MLFTFSTVNHWSIGYSTTGSTSTLKEQTIFVLGATSGIGFGVARASIDAGASTVIVASSSPEKVKRATERLEAHAKDNSLQVTIKGIAVNAKDFGAFEKVVKEIGTINHLVVTSGDVATDMMFVLNVHKTDAATMKNASSGLQDTHLWAAIQAARAATFAPGGSIVLTSGSTYMKPMPGMGSTSLPPFE